MNQPSLFKTELEYGGSYSAGRAKVRRPLSTKKPLHVVLRSSHAKGRLSLRNHHKEISLILKAQASRWQIRIYAQAINGNHIHLAILGKSKTNLQNFFRSFAGLVARVVTKSEKGRPFGRFWDRILWTRLVAWGKAFETLCWYIVRNILETMSVIPYERGKRRYSMSVLRC